MVAQIITIVISALGMGTVIGGLVLRKINKMDRKEDTREESRKRESILIFRGLQAIGHLSEATASAQKDGHTDGKMETAFTYYQGFTDDLNAYLLQQNAERNHGD